jgi:hypothetical protein
MPNHLSILGIFHTAISVLAVIIAVISLLCDGKIEPKSTSGKLYIIATIIACLTALPIMKTGHPSPGHTLAVVILLLLPLGVYGNSIKALGKGSAYLQVIVMSTTLFLSMIPAIVETLTRLPISHPLAADPNAPIVKMGLTALVLAFFAGIVYQVIKVSSKNKKSSSPADGSINLS